jgi:hypothetical protein
VLSRPKRCQLARGFPCERACTCSCQSLRLALASGITWRLSHLAEAAGADGRRPARRELVGLAVGLGRTVALYYHSSVYTRFTKIIGTSISEKRKLCRVGPNCETWPNTLTENCLFEP